MLVSGLIADRVVTREEMCGNAGIGLGLRVSADHASDVSGVARTMLLTNIVSWAADPVLGVLASGSEDVLIHL